MELNSERKKYQNFEEIEISDTFITLLDALQREARYIPSYQGLCIYTVGNNGPSLIKNEVNV